LAHPKRSSFSITRGSTDSDEAVPRDHATERPAQHELHRYEVDAVVLGNVMDGDNAGVVEC
jgi:hypothetical protein